MAKTKYRQCPICKSKKGFSLAYTINGSGREDRTFTGKVLDCERSTYDSDDRMARCLNCNGLIDSSRLEI